MVDVELSKKEINGRHEPLGIVEESGDTVYGSRELDVSQDTSSFAYDLVTDVTNAERMLLRQDAAHDPELKMKLDLLEETEVYLEASREAERKLEGEVPPFSEMIDKWVHDSLSESGQDQISDLEYAQTYRRLLDELSEDYREHVESGNIEALAEWDVVRTIVDIRIAEFTRKDMITAIRNDLELAA